MKNYRITVAGTGYVGLSIAVLLSQHHKVTAVDVVPEKVEMINHRKSPIQDEYIEEYLGRKGVRSDCHSGCQRSLQGCGFCSDRNAYQL